ncbi:MAG: MFS transporter [Negativicutes bacterium]|nr:MFS transporter [Negativicutes bacterium]
MEKPSRVRFLVLAMVCLLCCIAYLDRVNISVAAPAIMQEFHINKLELGAVFAAFSVGYVLLQIPIGRLGDNLGPRTVLTGLVTFWSIITGLTGLATNLFSLVAARFLFGIGQAGAFPTATLAFAQWTPVGDRGFFQGLTQASARFGGAVTPWIIAPLIVAWGWRLSFLLCALVGLVWAAGWYVWYRDNPKDYQSKWGSINQAELTLITDDNYASGTVPVLPIGRLLVSKNMWALSASYFCYCYCFWIFITWLPTYLVEARGFSFLGMGFFASLPLLVGSIGGVLGGWISDKIMARTANLKLARRAVAMTGLLLAALFLFPGVLTDSPTLSIFCLTGALFGLELSIGIYWTACLDVGHEYAGTVSATMNACGGVSSIVSPFLFGAIVQYTGSWVYPFMVSGGLLLVGALLWLRFDPELPLSSELHLTK